jgi:hypothetical protein
VGRYTEEGLGGEVNRPTCCCSNADDKWRVIQVAICWSRLDRMDVIPFSFTFYSCSIRRNEKNPKKGTGLVYVHLCRRSKAHPFMSMMSSFKVTSISYTKLTHPDCGIPYPFFLFLIHFWSTFFVFLVSYHTYSSYFIDIPLVGCIIGLFFFKFWVSTVSQRFFRKKYRGRDTPAVWASDPVSGAGLLFFFKSVIT